MEEEQQETNMSAATGWLYKLKMWLIEYKRIIAVMKKPSKEEFITVVKVSGLGIILIGLIGFIIQMVEVLVFK